MYVIFLFCVERYIQLLFDAIIPTQNSCLEAHLLEFTPSPTLHLSGSASRMGPKAQQWAEARQSNHF